MDKCRMCNNDFEKYQWNQKTCYDCLEKTDPRFKGRPKRKCLACETEFQPRVIRQMCCSSECTEKHKTNTYYLRTYGLTEEQYNAMLDEAGHKCEICGGEGFIMNGQRHRAKLVVDHCHENGHTRGMLCHNCNRGLGLFQDDTETLEKALKYLKDRG